jgi:hypothetical protein
MVLQMWQICSTFLKLYVAWFAATPQGKNRYEEAPKRVAGRVVMRPFFAHL